jgi:diaminohydroxyphosphoribosylaminopyrimidine deaminase/5-amino-6-(5-phosphoribosylamino)uracil reductase
MNRDDFYMQRCASLAMQGLGTTAPNPMVGCVIVYDDRIIGEGFHTAFGKPHAEVMAVQSVKDAELLAKSTLYVSLEPCCHYGKTPSCTQLIIQSNLKRVVVGTLDPFPAVAGKGVQQLKDAGIEVVCGVQEDLCKDLNKRFFTFHNKKRPYIVLKWAQTSDGFIDVIRTNDEPRILWISGEQARVLVHKWRAEEQAIMIGANTAQLDNPSLTTRYWHGKNPLRVVIDTDGALPGTLNVFNNEAETLYFTAKKNISLPENIRQYVLDFTTDVIPGIFSVLVEMNIQSVIVEGGNVLLNSLIQSQLWDEARVFTSGVLFGAGIAAPEIFSEKKELVKVQDDSLVYYYNQV